jgi:uncharacterized protein YcnI
MNLRAFAVLLAAVPGLASSHAVVTPNESAPGAIQQYTLHVPNEKDVPTVSVQVLFPAEMDVNAVAEQDGWRLEVGRDANGHIVRATWTGSLPPKANAQFKFTARNPATPMTVAWNVVQIYDGHLTVEWTGAAGSKTPASRTEIH